MDDCTSVIVTDAVPHSLPGNNFDEHIRNRKFTSVSHTAVKTLLNKFTVDDFKSLFFLLLDYIELDDYLDLVTHEKTVLEERFHNLLYKKLNEKILIELLGTLKMYDELKSFDTCYHIFEAKRKDFDEIRKIWKILFSLCEEITNSDLRVMKEYIPPDVNDKICSAEEWFAYALKLKIITEADLSRLNQIFKDYPVCLQIINEYKAEDRLRFYCIRTPTPESDCGIAVIFNFETFEVPTLQTREGSNVDIDSLRNLWNTFGFKTIVFENLKSSELKEKLNGFAEMNHMNYDAFVCCFLSHGDSDVIYASDGCKVPIPALIAIMTDNCSTLEGKPKLFFIQACQGSKVQVPGKPVYSREEKSTDAVHSTVHPTSRDVYKVTSTVDGFVSFRSTKHGSLFVKTMCRVMLEYDDSYTIDDVMTVVTDKVLKHPVDLGPGKPDNAVQIVLSSSTLNKKLILKKRNIS